MPMFQICNFFVLQTTLLESSSSYPTTLYVLGAVPNTLSPVSIADTQSILIQV